MLDLSTLRRKKRPAAHNADRDEVRRPRKRERNAAIRRDRKERLSTNAIPQDLGQLLSRMKRTCDEIQSSTTCFGIASPPCPSLARRRLQSEDAEFRDTTSPANFVHSLNLARSVLEQRGVLSTPGQNNASRQVSKDTAQSPDINAALLRAARPVLDVGYEAVLHLVTIFNLEIYTTYPCIDLDFANEKIDAIFRISSDSSNEEAEDLEIDLIDVEIMKVVLAIAMLTEDNGSSLSSDIESNLIWSTDINMKEETAQLEDIIMASLLTIYFILKDKAAKAWRFAGFAAKSCLELGMHKDSFFENRNVGSDKAIFQKTLFCCVYDLDKRCSFFTNLPWTLHDKDIDESVFDLNSRHPYLSAMIGLNRIHSEIVELVNSSAPENKETDERAEYLDFRVQKLVESIPQSGFFPPESTVVPLHSKQVALETFFQLRTSHIRMLTHIRSLSSSHALAYRPRSARTLISLAKSTVDLHVKAIKHGGVDRLLRPTLDKLLMSSISCMFLAASYDPSEYGPMCCNDFHAALNTLSQSEFRLNRLNSNIWCTLDDLRTMGNSIQMPTPEQSPVMMTSSEGPSTGLDVIQQQFVEEDFFGTFESTDHDLLAVFGDVNSRILDSSNMNSYIDCIYDESALPPLT
ncbi:hypothetical protein V500_07540 [Pseudogymnoascus sp. VKM F-4518 (FW-2643)]|nr:hypothetical protein V500_07540 [Pseudogymnoascus sp. VKM F-4518 (FW-2643)]